ncbi:hypothetical protein LguiA_031912 [Lonicera macranthoides]
MDGSRRDLQYFSDNNKSPLFRDEELAAENIYIKKMEKERMEKLKAEKEKEKSEKKAEGETHSI